MCGNGMTYQLPCYIPQTCDSETDQYLIIDSRYI